MDVWSGDELAGGAVTSRDVPIGIIPVYCRAGSWPAMREIFAT
ncbi:alpha-glucosidase (family GH31 glycosyl hydrolase) [Planotetraspora sp. GP83]